MNNHRTYIATLLIAAASCLTGASAQETASVAPEEEDNVVVVSPLFEYVEAPDDRPDLRSRTDYLMDHFWDPFDFKNTTVVDQNALNHAFGVYVEAMAYASDKKVENSIKTLIGKIKNNPGLSYQFTKAAEENLYGPRAELSGDEVYIEFLRNLVGNKKVKESLKKNYIDKLEKLERTMKGKEFPPLQLTNTNGTELKYSPTKEYAIIEVTTPVHPDNTYTSLKLDISGTVNDLYEDGKLQIDVIVLDDKKPQGNFPDKWNLYYSPDLTSTIDIRRLPGFFVTGPGNKIVGKNLTVDEAIELLEALTTKP